MLCSGLSACAPPLPAIPRLRCRWHVCMLSTFHQKEQIDTFISASISAAVGMPFGTLNLMTNMSTASTRQETCENEGVWSRRSRTQPRLIMLPNCPVPPYNCHGAHLLCDLSCASLRRSVTLVFELSPSSRPGTYAKKLIDACKLCLFTWGKP